MIHEQVIATELLKGQGLGNQLFCYVTTRCLAMKNHSQFAILNKEILANNIHSNKGMYFMDIDCGLDMKKEEFSEIYQEKEDRIYLGNSIHDIEHGCYISGADEKLLRLAQSTLVYGNMQDEAYFGQYKGKLRTSVGIGLLRYWLFSSAMAALSTKVTLISAGSSKCSYSSTALQARRMRMRRPEGTLIAFCELVIKTLLDINRPLLSFLHSIE